MKKERKERGKKGRFYTAGKSSTSKGKIFFF